jgi:hypothetical protein
MPAAKPEEIATLARLLDGAGLAAHVVDRG